MRKLIIITGDLSVGKSTFAAILSKKCNITVMYKDRIKEVLCDAIGFANREENLRLSKATVELMTYGFYEMYLLSQDLIIEANFKENELVKIHNIAEKSGYDVLTLKLTADIDIIYHRFVNRIENENRHPAHISGFDGYDSLKYYIEAGRKQATPGRVLEINADNFDYQSDESLFSLIKDFLTEN
jgi:2-phosphoglycerate kinase